MKYNDLSINKKPDKKRKGRGIAAGQGKTAGRGTKGQNARTGGGVKPGFEGGQNPLAQRMPKLRGFTSHRPNSYAVQVGQLNTLGAKITNESLADNGLIPSPFVRVKVIAGGALSKKINVKLQGVSETARKQIEAQGGSFEVVALPKRQPKNQKSTQTS